jgi:hypothetical protein
MFQEASCNNFLITPISAAPVFQAHHILILLLLSCTQALQMEAPPSVSTQNCVIWTQVSVQKRNREDRNLAASLLHLSWMQYAQFRLLYSFEISINVGWDINLIDYTPIACPAFVNLFLWGLRLISCRYISVRTTTRIRRSADKSLAFPICRTTKRIFLG